MNSTDLVLPNGTVIPDSNAATGVVLVDDLDDQAPVPTPAALNETHRPRLVVICAFVALLALVAGAGYRLGAAWSGHPLWPAVMAPLAWWLVQAGAAGLVLSGTALLIWGRDNRS
jgi:hypothetical protein